MNDLAKKLIGEAGELPSEDGPVIGSKARRAIKYFVSEMGGEVFLERFDDFLINSGIDTGAEDIDAKAEEIADQKLVGRGLEVGTLEYDTAYDAEYDKAYDALLAQQQGNASNPIRTAIFNLLVEELRKSW